VAASSGTDLDKLDHPKQKLDHPKQKLDHPKQKLDHPKQKLDHPKHKLDHPKHKLDHPKGGPMGLEEKLPSGVLLTTVEGVAGYMRKASFWPATFGLACCAIEMMTSGGPRYDLARFGMEVFRASPRQADLMIVAGRVSQKMAPVLRQIYDQMANPKYVLAMGVCASSGGMFNNYAILQGVDHVVPVDMYLPGCPPRPEMLIDAILKLHAQVQSTKLGVNRANQIEEQETDALNSLPTSHMKGLLR
jgi:NADH-quinone oxidoreductase subunit B